MSTYMKNVTVEGSRYHMTVKSLREDAVIYEVTASTEPNELNIMLEVSVGLETFKEDGVIVVDPVIQEQYMYHFWESDLKEENAAPYDSYGFLIDADLKVHGHDEDVDLIEEWKDRVIEKYVSGDAVDKHDFEFSFRRVEG